MLSDPSPGPSLGSHPRLASGLGMHMGVWVCMCVCQAWGMGGMLGTEQWDGGVAGRDGELRA